jgi:hypothetical protein
MTACGSHHRQMVDRLVGRSIAALHRLAALATGKGGLSGDSTCPLAVATLARWWIGKSDDLPQPSTAWRRWLRGKSAYEDADPLETLVPAALAASPTVGSGPGWFRLCRSGTLQRFCKLFQAAW